MRHGLLTVRTMSALSRDVFGRMTTAAVLVWARRKGWW